MTYSTLLYSVANGVARITLNRPERLNAITADLTRELREAVLAANEDHAVRVIVLAGAGRAFCAGYDLDWGTKAEDAAQRSLSGGWDPVRDYLGMSRNVRSFMSFWESPKPTIAQLHGWCVGGGTDMALCCDLIYVAEDVRIGYPPARAWGEPTLQLCSTSEVYGQVLPDEVPISEDQPLRPVSPYAVSKVTQDLLGLAYFRSFGMRIIRTRMFSYLNPRRTDLFATAFARQVARIEAGLQDELVHGNLDSVRTIIDVRDAMESYWLAALHCEPGEAYNIGGATTISVGEFLELLIRLGSPAAVIDQHDGSKFRSVRHGGSSQCSQLPGRGCRGYHRDYHHDYQ